MLGGIITPSVPAAQSAPMEKDFEYPASRSAGYITAPTATSVTVPDPVTAANIAQAKIAAIASPPGMAAVSDCITRIRRVAMPPSRHDVAGQYVERDCEQDVLVERAPGIENDAIETLAAKHQVGIDGDAAKDDEQALPQDQQRQNQRNQQHRGHDGVAAPPNCSALCPRGRRSGRAA